MVAINEIFLATLNGLSQGMLLFLTAVGLTLIFGVLGILNFAHGSFYMLGAYFTVILFDVAFATGSNVGFLVALLVIPPIVGVLGILIERFLLRPVYDQDHVFQLLLTFGLVLVIDNVVRFIWGTDFRSVAIPDIFSGTVPLFGQSYPLYNMILIVAGLAMAIAMWLLFERTRMGKIVRAAAQDRDMANAHGINVPRLFTTIFFVGVVLAAVGGVLAAPYQAIQPQMGENIIIESFVVVVIGGLGSFGGAFVGSLLIGGLSAFSLLIVPQLEPILPFVLMAAVLLLRPAGLLGVDVE